MRLDSLNFKVADKPGEPAIISIKCGDTVEVEARQQRGWDFKKFVARVVSVDTINKTITLDSSTNMKSNQRSYEFENVRTMKKAVDLNTLICYIEDINGGYFCKAEDSFFFIKEAYKNCGGVICDVKTKEEFEKEYNREIKILDRNVNNNNNGKYI